MHLFGYLDSSLISILNKLNNISFENFYVTTEKVSLDESNPSGADTSESSKNTDDSKEENSKTEGEDEDEKKQSSSNSGKGDDSSITVSDMKSHNILLGDRNDIDWNNIKSSIENLYDSWNTIIIDLYKLGINNEDILKFSSFLDESILNIKQENRENSLLSLAKLYNMLPVFKDSYSDDTTNINIKWTKAHIINAYVLVGNKDWNTALYEIGEAEKAYSSILTDTNFVSTKQYNTNKTYVALKELQNSSKNQDEDIFYIKYKNFMEEVNLL